MVSFTRALVGIHSKLIDPVYCPWWRQSAHTMGADRGGLLVMKLEIHMEEVKLEGEVNIQSEQIYL